MTEIEKKIYRIISYTQLTRHLFQFKLANDSAEGASRSRCEYTGPIDAVGANSSSATTNNDSSRNNNVSVLDCPTSSSSSSSGSIAENLAHKSLAFLMARGVYITAKIFICMHLAFPTANRELFANIVMKAISVPVQSSSNNN